jgi:phosphopantothenate-cysteine ligase
MKLNVLVTSGGTTENIDTVRKISNISTGKLGGLTAGRFADEADVDKIFYVCSRSAFKPQTGKLEIVYVDDVFSLENTIKEIIGKANIDIIVHSMAVSDYRVKTVTSTVNVANFIFSNLDMVKQLDPETAKTAFASILDRSESIIRGDGKISSDVEDMVLFMERTPKIISMFQSLSPQSTLVGFKLLDNVPHADLIDKGYQILTQNKCSFVLANDLKDIKGEQHIGYLIDKDKNYTRYTSKSEIAGIIVSATLRERRERL